MIRINCTKPFESFKTRILAKVTALMLVQYINKFIFNRPINNVKNQTVYYTQPVKYSVFQKRLN